MHWGDLLKQVKQIKLKHGLTVSMLAEEMDGAGVLGAGRVGKAVRLASEMLSNPEYTVFLSLAGPMVPGGLRRIIVDLIEMEFVDVVVSTGANLVHDMVEALGFRHYVGSFRNIDQELRRKGLGRIGDILISQEAFKRLEDWLTQMLEDIPEDKRQRIASHEILYEIGKRLADSDSILVKAANKQVPVLCPNLADSIAGFQMWAFSQDHKLLLDPLLDTEKIVEIVFDSKKMGAIILGGGWPKHYTLFSTTFREGLDCAIQITMDRPEPGGLSGASLEEAISWSKVKSEENTVTVISDATIIFPLIISAALDRV